MPRKVLRRVNPYTILLLIGVPLAVLGLITLYRSFGNLYYNTGSLAVMLFLVSGLLTSAAIPILIILRRNYKVKLTAWNGEYWVHWQYTVDEQADYVHYLPRGAREVYVTSGGAYFPGARFPVKAVGGVLQDVGVQVGPVNVLRLTYATADVNTTDFKLRPSRGGYSRVGAESKHIDIPIPRGCEDAARQLSETWVARPVAGKYYIAVKQVVLMFAMMSLSFCVCSVVAQGRLKSEPATPYPTPTSIPMAAITHWNAELAAIREKVDDHIRAWQALPYQEWTQISPLDIGFAPDSGVESVSFGYCGFEEWGKTFFYILVIEPDPGAPHEVDAYVYIDSLAGSGRSACPVNHPAASSGVSGQLQIPFYAASGGECTRRRFKGATQLTLWTALAPSWFHVRLYVDSGAKITL